MSKSKFKQTEIWMIPEDWEVKELNAVASYITKKINLEKINTNNFISTENMLPEKGGVIPSSSLPKVGKITQFKEGDILFSNIRTYFKKIWLAKFSGGCSNDVLVIRKKPFINNHYLFYYLSQDKFFDFTVLTSKGTKMPRGDKNSIMGYKVYLPPLPEQRAIAKILSDLDAKIELNQQMNKTLEEIGKAIFKHWFVDFEFPNDEGKPYKSSGGEMEYNEELGKEIPKGWRVENFGKILKFERGIEPGAQEYLNEASEDNVKFYKVADLLNLDTNTYIKKSIASNLANFGDVLASFDGTPGRISISVNGAFSSGIRKIYDPKNEYTSSFIFFLMHSKYIQNVIKIYSKGTTILHASEAINHFIYYVPPRNILTKFINVVDVIFKKIVSNNIQIITLSSIRDALLPKLMSGKIRVPLEVIR